jgi:hypothetical protein
LALPFGAESAPEEQPPEPPALLVLGLGLVLGLVLVVPVPGPLGLPVLGPAVLGLGTGLPVLTLGLGPPVLILAAHAASPRLRPTMSVPQTAAGDATPVSWAQTFPAKTLPWPAGSFAAAT